MMVTPLEMMNDGAKTENAAATTYIFSNVDTLNASSTVVAVTTPFSSVVSPSKANPIAAGKMRIESINDNKRKTVLLINNDQ